MPLVAMGLICVGYVLMYWGIDNSIAWKSSDEFDSGASSLSNGTDAVEMPVLFGFPYTEKKSTKVLNGLHEVPFPYHPTKASGALRPIDTAPGTGTAPPASTPTNTNPIRQV